MKIFKTIALLIMLFPFLLLHAQIENKNKKEPPHWRIGIYGGASYLLGNTSKAKNTMTSMGIDAKWVDNYYKELKWGSMAGVDFHYFFKPQLGVGVKSLLYSNAAQMDEKVSLPFNGDGVSLAYGQIKENIYIHYIGPSFVTRDFLGNQRKWALTSLLSVGYVHYRDETALPYISMLLTGSTIGLHGAVGIEYHVTKGIAVGLDIAYMYAFLSKIKFSDGSSTQSVDLGNEKENLSRMDISLGLKYYF